LEIKNFKSKHFLKEDSMETKGVTENNIEQNTSTISEPMDEVSLSLFLQCLIVYIFFQE